MEFFSDLAKIYLFDKIYSVVPPTSSRDIMGARSGTPMLTASALKPICPPSPLVGQLK